MLSRMSSVFTVVLAMAALLACPAPGYATEILLNGSFETTDVTGVEQWAAYGDTSNLPNWFVDRNGGDFAYLNNGPANDYPAQDGNVYLNPLNGPCSVKQTFAVSAGNSYAVSFYEALREGESTTFGLNVSATVDAGTLTGTSGTLAVDGSGSNVLSGFANQGNNTWTQFTFSFVPSASGNVELMFITNDPGDMVGYGVYLDNVSVNESAVPEPSTLAVLAAGLAGLLCYAWRKRR
jgi:hypothetical protein